jgi:hypothetical protein
MSSLRSTSLQNLDKVSVCNLQALPFFHTRVINTLLQIPSWSL